MKKRFLNPISFTPLPVTIITFVTYLALFVALLVIHHTVPAGPSSSNPIKGINLIEAWQDLQTLSNGYHPYNSRRNDVIRDWLLRRIKEILNGNNVTCTAYGCSSNLADGNMSSPGPHPVVIFNDVDSNVTSSVPGLTKDSKDGEEPGLSVYFEGTNIIVYIRGSEDDKNDWWSEGGKPEGKGGVLMNAHYDSVSTGYGATDDGIGVITILQLIQYFTATGHTPKRGIVALLNNGEEDFLNGARAFGEHPMSKFTHTFLNLEGAGAGGRAALFRSTDTEITRFYQRSKHPYGTVLSADGFSAGFVRSQTDYVVFNKDLGLRGLDFAFTAPRSRYHTDQDDARHTSMTSLWHMLSAALATMEGLTMDTSSDFDGKNHRSGKVSSGKGTDGVWFDLFGKAFAVFRLRTLFAISVTLLIVAPLTLMSIVGVLLKLDKLYLFTSSRHHHHPEGDDNVKLRGWAGFFRYPIMFVLASAGVIGLAFLITKLNPYIIYSSPYAVWSMMLSVWLFIAWFVSRAADFVRPTSLHRAYSLFWTFVGSWLVLIGVTVLEDRFEIAAGYFVVFYFAAVYLATSIAFLELLRLPRRSAYADEFEAHEGRARSVRSGSMSGGNLLDENVDEQTNDYVDGADDVEATESTSLLRDRTPTTFARYKSPERQEGSEQEGMLDDKTQRRVYGSEQQWSWSLPGWTWLLQFLLIAPITIILVGQIGLLLVSGTYQTLADGNSALTLYVVVGLLSILLLTPLGPFLHRYTYHLPAFLFLVFVGTLIYNLVAFPFSSGNRLKLYFIQHVDLDTGINRVSLTGIGNPYISETIQSLPSVTGQGLDCNPSKVRPDLTECSWSGIPPRVVNTPVPNPEVSPEHGYADWLHINVTRLQGKNEAHFNIWGRDTRACRILFNNPISDFNVEGAGTDHRYKRVPEAGSKEIRLWSRTWEKPWNGKVRWDVGEGKQEGEEGLDGRAVCLWSDDNETGVIPALDEVRHFAPVWVAVSKLSDGLIEGSKAFKA